MTTINLAQLNSSNTSITLIVLDALITLEDYLNWINKSNQVILLDGAANQIKKFIEDNSVGWPSLIVGDFDSVSEETLSFFRGNTEIELIQDQDYTDLQKGLWKSTGTYIVIIGGVCGRFDHFFSMIKNIMKQERPVFYAQKNELILKVPKGRTTVYLDREWSYIGYFPVVRQAIVTTVGLKWDLENYEVSMQGLVSSSNESLGEQILFESSEDLLLTLSNNR